MRTFATAFASATALALLVSAASAGGGFGDGGCYPGHTAKLAAVEKEQPSMSTFEGQLPPVTEAEEAAIAEEPFCEDGDAACEQATDQ